jgi:N-acetylglucosamine kinase-like BadF-type ATPase
MKMSTTYVIGMDGGGTKTAAILADGDGNIIAEHLAGPSNFQIIGVEKTAKILFELIESCCESAHCIASQLRSITIGLTGAGRAVDQKRMAKGLQNYAASRRVRLKKLAIESDARIALEGAFKGAPGIILIAGTGSIAFGKDVKGSVHRVGGWGRILGDEGSGFFIGRLGLTAVTRQLDGRSSATKLTEMVAKQFGLKDQIDIITEVYRNNFDIASIAPVVMEAAMKNDEVSRAIIRTASIELSEHVKSLAAKLRSSNRGTVKEKISLAFIGGLIANNTILSEAVRNQIELEVSDIHILPPMAPPVYGAVLMALTSLH